MTLVSDKAQPVAQPIKADQAQALLAALNDLFKGDWQMQRDGSFVVDRLEVGGFGYKRPIQPRHINQPYRMAAIWSEEVCEQYGRWALMESGD
jgi:hypothetical protein